MTREELDEILDGRRLVVSVSGGKDSTAVCLHLMELGYAPDEYDRVFFDTGWEHQVTLDYLRGPLVEHVGPIEWVREVVDLPEELVPIAEELERELGQSPSAMIRLILKKGMFPSRVKRFCTQLLKVKPAGLALAARDPAVNVVGIRAAESKARSIMGEWDVFNVKLPGVKWRGDVWRPLIDWTVEDVIAIHQRAGLRPNPLYLKSSSRVGCWPCIYARKAEIRNISNETPERIALLQRLEQVISRMATWKQAEAGNPPTVRSWFQAPIRKRMPDGSRSGECWPIQRVVEWSRTARGGRQVELFADTDGHQGCVRWGMCETPE